MSTENTGPGFLSSLAKGKYNLWIFVGVAVGVGYWLGKRSERSGLRQKMSQIQQQVAAGTGGPVAGMGNLQAMQAMQGRNSMGFEPVNLAGYNSANPCPDNVPANQQVPAEEFEFMG